MIEIHPNNYLKQKEQLVIEFFLNGRTLSNMIFNSFCFHEQSVHVKNIYIGENTDRFLKVSRKHG